MINGILLIDKPSGVSSYDVIRDIKRDVRAYMSENDSMANIVDDLWPETFRPAPGIEIFDNDGVTRRFKIGHAGTLDPFATGLLIILLGRATKLFDYFQSGCKVYQVEAEFGYETDTLDRTGEIVCKADASGISMDEIKKAIADNFIGEIKQKPPKYSAKKVKGRRACDIMREGGDVELGARKINVVRFDIVSRQLQTGGDVAKLKFEIECSSGTYVRSLIADLGRELGVYGNTTELRRTSIMDYKL